LESSVIENLDEINEEDYENSLKMNTLIEKSSFESEAVEGILRLKFFLPIR
jgi:hypothetical protein